MRHYFLLLILTCSSTMVYCQSIESFAITNPITGEEQYGLRVRNAGGVVIRTTEPIFFEAPKCYDSLAIGVSGWTIFEGNKYALTRQLIVSCYDTLLQLRFVFPIGTRSASLHKGFFIFYSGPTPDGVFQGIASTNGDIIFSPGKYYLVNNTDSSFIAAEFREREDGFPSRYSYVIHIKKMGNENDAIILHLSVSDKYVYFGSMKSEEANRLFSLDYRYFEGMYNDALYHIMHFNWHEAIGIYQQITEEANEYVRRDAEYNLSVILNNIDTLQSFL